MKFEKTLRIAIVVCILLFTIHYSPFTVSAQRDYFTPEEVELVRDAQQIDERIDVLTYAIDRRFAALKLDVGGPKISPKDSEKWGAFPAGTRGQLLLDIRRILQKAIDDIDSLESRRDSMVMNPEDDPKKKKSFDDIFPKAMRALAKAANRYQPVLKSEIDKTKDTAELGSLIDSIDMCDQIIAALAKLPAEVKKNKK